MGTMTAASACAMPYLRLKLAVIASALRSMLLVAAAAAVALPASPAGATLDTLKRSITNITLWPLDLVASPVTVGQTVVGNLQDIEDTTAVRVFYAVPGYVFLTGINVGASVLRGVTGVLELLPALVLAFMDADLDPLFDPVENNRALVDWQNDVLPLKFGIDYSTVDF